MSHIPINHPLRPLYRVLAALTGLFVLIFGVVGYFATKSAPLFSQSQWERVLGLRTNGGFALLSIGAGVILVIGALIGRNVDRFVNFVGAVVFMVVGMLALLVLRTDLNFLAFSVTNCVVSFTIGMILFAASLYGKTGSADAAAREEAHRH